MRTRQECLFGAFFLKSRLRFGAVFDDEVTAELLILMQIICGLSLWGCPRPKAQTSLMGLRFGHGMDEKGNDVGYGFERGEI